MLVRYEDLKRNTERELGSIAHFLGVAPDPKLLTRAIQQSSADRMRELEQKQQHQWIGTKKHRKDIPFVGQASTGTWEQKLPAVSVSVIEAAWGELMVTLGYELSVPDTRGAGNIVSAEFSPGRT
jgi:hypothetical protein